MTYRIGEDWLDTKQIYSAGSVFKVYAKIFLEELGPDRPRTEETLWKWRRMTSRWIDRDSFLIYNGIVFPFIYFLAMLEIMELYGSQLFWAMAFHGHDFADLQVQLQAEKQRAEQAAFQCRAFEPR